MKKKINIGLICAGGSATRFQPYSLAMPKEMLPINATPAIHYVFEECIAANIFKIIIVTRHENNYIKDYFLNNSSLKEFVVENERKFSNDDSIEVIFIEEALDILYGNAAPLIAAKKILSETSDPFAVLFGDDVILEKTAIKELADMYTDDMYALIATTLKNDEDIKHFGNVLYDSKEKSRIIQIKQKPKIKISNDALISRIILTNNIYDYIKISENNNELDLGYALCRLIEEQKLVCGCRITGTWVSVDSPEFYYNALTVARKLIKNQE